MHFLLVQYLITFVMNLFKATPQIPTLHPLFAQQSEAITSEVEKTPVFVKAEEQKF